MYPCEQVGLEFLDRAPQRFSNSVDLAVTPDEIWEVLADAEAWPHWASVITNVIWTSPEPHGVGTTRVVDMRGGIVGDVGALPLASWGYPTRLRGRISGGLGTAQPHGFSVQPSRSPQHCSVRQQAVRLRPT